MIYSEAERKEIERVYGVFKDYIHASKFLDFVWSEKLGYLLLHIDPTKNTIEEDQIIASADELCAELFNEVATDVFQEAKREHFYPDLQYKITQHNCENVEWRANPRYTLWRQYCVISSYRGAGNHHPD